LEEVVVRVGFGVAGREVGGVDLRRSRIWKRATSMDVRRFFAV